MDVCASLHGAAGLAGVWRSAVRARDLPREGLLPAGGPAVLRVGEGGEAP